MRNYLTSNEDWYSPLEISQLNSISRCLISPCKSLLDCDVFNMIYFDWSRLIMHGFCSGFFTLTKLTSTIYPKFHYTSAQVNFVEALVEMFSDETIAISADDKHKVNVGTLAVSWHITKYLLQTIKLTNPIQFSLCQCLTCSCWIFITRIMK